MSEMMSGDEMLFSLWPDHFLKPGTLDWPLKDQQIVPVPIVLLDDGRVAFQSDDGQICLVDGLQGVGEDVCFPLPPCLDDPTAELPALSDATIKSMLVHSDPNSELPLVGPEMPELGGKDLPESSLPELENKDLPESSMAVDDDFHSLVSFRCQHCSFSSADVPSLMHHSKTHHTQTETCGETKSNTVEKMDSSLPSVTEVNEPLGDIVEQFVYLCSECKEGFSSLMLCRDHMIKDHNMVFDDLDDSEVDVETEGPQPIPSPPASVPLSTTSDLPPAVPPPTPKSPAVILLRTPTKTNSRSKEFDPEFDAKPHKCPEAFCVHKFRTLGYLDQHMECHTPDDSRRFICPKCSMLFVKWGQCAAHLWKEHKIDVDLYTCNVCGTYKTTTRRKLESHAKIHSEERPYKCTECGKGFKQRTQLVNHVVSVHNKDKDNHPNAPKWYMTQKCEICFKTYADSKCLKKHMQAVHSKLKPYKCQICGHMSARKAMLQAHVRQHTGEKPFACELCSFKTGDHNSLRRHVMRHTGKRPYSCPHCPYSSIQSSSFKSHLQSRHPGQSGTFTCNKCYFATVNEQSYYKHMSDHNLNLIPPNDVEVFPENVAAAHLVYRSFGASPSRLHCDVTASATSRDGMKQTITISIPSADTVTDDEDTNHCFLPGDELDTGGITIPAEPEPESQIICFN